MENLAATETPANARVMNDMTKKARLGLSLMLLCQAAALSARAALPRQKLIPEAMKACSAAADCRMTEHGGCCGAIGPINKASLKGWGLERRTEFGGAQCRRAACPAGVDETAWTKVSDCIAGKCRLRPVESEAECARTPAAGRCVGVWKEQMHLDGICMGCLGDSCDCGENRIGFKWKNRLLSCRFWSTTESAVDKALKGSQALRNACLSKPGARTTTLTTCFGLSQGFKRLYSYQVACS